MVLKDDNQTATQQKQASTGTPQRFSFLVAAGKVKQLIDSDLFSDTHPSLLKINLVQATGSTKDLFRARSGAYWSVKGSLPEINLTDTHQVAFDVKFQTTSSLITTSSAVLGEFKQNLTLVANKNLYKYNPGIPLHARTTYNPEYWKVFISDKKVPQVSLPLVISPPIATATKSAQPIFTADTKKLNDLQAEFLRHVQTANFSINTKAVNQEQVFVGSQPSKALNLGPAQKQNTGLSINLNQTQVKQQVDGQQANVAFRNTIGDAVLRATTSSVTINLKDAFAPKPPVAVKKDEFKVLPTIQEAHTFYDHAFELNIPFTKKELDAMHAPIGSMFVDIQPNYNFFVDNYESAINNNATREQLLPNMYAFCTELRNENTDEKNTIFKQHITLAGTIPDAFVDVTNNKGEKIGEKDKGEYFDRYASAFAELMRLNPPAENFLRRKFTNLVAPISNMDLFKEFNEKRELFPMYFDLSFSTDNSTQFAQILEDSQLSSVLVKDIIDGNLVAEPLPFHESVVKSQEKVGKISRSISTTKKHLRTYDLSAWVNRIANNPVGSFDALQTGVFLGTLNDEIKLATNSQYDLFKNLLVIIFIGKLKTLIDESLRSFEEILKGKLAYSENVLYRIEKSDTATGQVIQNFHLPNSNKIDILRFIDTQVKYNKQYTYKIYVYQMVLGNKYHYTLNELKDDTANVDVFNEPSLKLVETLFYEFTGRVMDNPPVAPEVDIIPYRGINNQILFNINSATGRYFLEPILIEPSDAAIIRQLREAQKVGENEFLEFETDDRAAAFEIFRLDRKPHKFQDFTGKRIALVPTDVSSFSLQSATAASFIDNVLPNRKYYYIFRAIDNHGHISNPTTVFQLEIVDANGSIYPIIQVVDFEKDADLRLPYKTGRKFIQLVPAFNQRLINEEKSGLIVDGKRIDSVLDKEKIHLGVADEQVWGKTFRIRLTSRKTGKKVDFDVQFNHEHVRKVD